MPILPPVLDDRSFDQIRGELMDRIPVYNPDWTDYSRSDPAVTLLELFAFLGEGLQFRFNQIPEATQLAFLKLLDLPLRTACPATALLRVQPKAGPLAPRGVIFYAGDQLRAGKTVFTVDADAPCWPLDCVTIARKPTPMPDAATEPELHGVVQGKIDAVADATPGLGAVVTYRPVALAPDGSTPPLDFSDTIDGSVWIAVLKDPALALDPGMRGVVSVTVGVSPARVTPALDEVPACPGEAPSARPALEWRATAAKPTPSGKPRLLPLRVAADGTEGFTAEGVARIELPADLATVGAPPAPPGLEGTGDYPPVLENPDQASRLWFWLRVWRADGSRIGTLQGIWLNALSATQSIATAPELLGTGNGQPSQAFALANRPVLVDPRNPIRLQVEEAGSWTDWQPRDDLDASGRSDRHFTVDAEAGTIRFGRRAPQIGERIRVLSYRHGGGAAGNVPAKAIAALGQPMPDGAPYALRPLAAGPAIANPFPAAGGADAETVEEGLTRIAGELRRRNRAVTRDDFAELALQTPGVQLGRAECLPLFHAPDRAHPRAGVVSVVVWPASDPQHPEAPVPDTWQLRQVCRWLDTRRLVTTELYVIPPSYRPIALSVALSVKDGYGLDAVRNWVELVLRRYLAPLPPYGPDGKGWPLGRRILDRELEGVAMQVEGVAFVEAIALAALVDGTWQRMGTVPLERWEVPEIVGVTIVDGPTPPDPADGVKPPSGGNPVPIPVLREEC
ncbi:putative baseplate assembly protein [Falsiroseomonas sp. HW251]|uniref:putative baseplate assembly protein n=1 Tax=Falsiroseomonas sp. HW251 TaxID=3390998 RepID=UPI003D317896